MSTKVHVKYGAVEVTYEGDANFGKSDLLGLLKAVTDAGQPENATEPEIPEMKGTGADPRPKNGKIPSSVTAIAQKMGVKSGPDLVIAACAYLQLVENKSSFTTKEITSAMRDAKTYFKPSYASNLTKIIQQLTKDNTITSPNANNYCLMEAKVTSLKATLA